MRKSLGYAAVNVYNLDKQSDLEYNIMFGVVIVFDPANRIPPGQKRAEIFNGTRGGGISNIRYES